MAKLADEISFMQGGGPGSGRRPGYNKGHVIQFSYKGRAKDRGQQGKEYTQQDMDNNLDNKKESQIQKLADKHGAKRVTGPNQHIFSNKVYHGFKLPDEDSAQKFIKGLQQKGFSSIEHSVDGVSQTVHRN